MIDLVDALVRLLRDYGPWGILLAVIAFVAFFPEKSERIAGWALGLFAWTGSTMRRRSIIARLQGRISEFSRSVNGEAYGLMPYNLHLAFVKDVDKAELDQARGTVIVRIRDSGDTARNMANAMLAFAPVGCLPEVRPYIEPSLSQAIDVTITRRFLLATRQLSALGLLSDRVAGFAENKRIAETCLTLTGLDEHGLFTRIFLDQLGDLGSLLSGQLPRREHAEEAEAFLGYLDKVAKRQRGEELREVGYRGRFIATAVVLVGRTETMLDSGAKRYTDHLRRLRDDGYQTAFLAARDRGEGGDTESMSSTMARHVSQVAETSGLAEEVRVMRFHAVDADGMNRPHILIELALLSL